ncbi:hypothetical protein SM033_00291 [Vibrio phage vB_VpaM_sm033]|nr:hypothetical protein SM033_00291 [Vibrio phage vB_VpaM_sm033]
MPTVPGTQTPRRPMVAPRFQMPISSHRLLLLQSQSQWYMKNKPTSK